MKPSRYGWVAAPSDKPRVFVGRQMPRFRNITVSFGVAVIIKTHLYADTESSHGIISSHILRKTAQGDAWSQRWKKVIQNRD